jgi:sugar O-acyltransferase (sialic acid O-acetyltransferase NeuD family)
MRQLILLGANNPEVVRQARELERGGDVKVLGFLDNDAAKKGSIFEGYAVFGGVELAGNWLESAEFVNVITRDAQTRHDTSVHLRMLGARFGQFIHPSVYLDMVKMDGGSYIQEDAVLQARVKLGWNCSVSAKAIINHESCLGDSVFVAPGANICGKVNIGNRVFIGASAVILPRLTIGDGAVIGAGAVVTKDVAPGCVVVGNPAREIRT